jgi:hypothetical protein
MQEKKRLTLVNKDTLRAFVTREYGSFNSFAQAHGLNVGSLYKFMQGDNTLTNVNRKCAEVLADAKVDPFAEYEFPEISPDLRMQLVGQTA